MQREVRLVRHPQAGCVRGLLRRLNYLQVCGGHRLGAVEDHYDEAGLSEGAAGAVHAHALDWVLSIGTVAQPRRVGEHQRYAAQVHDLIERVAGRAWDGGDDGAVGPQQGVQEAGFAYVGLTHDSSA